MTNRLSLVFLLLLISACTEISWLDVPIPDGATQIYQDHPSSLYNRHTSFIYKREYPDISIISNIEKRLESKEAWVTCSYGGEDWQDFLDESGEEPNYIFQRLKAWKTKNNDRNVFVSLRYYVNKPKGIPKEPSNNLQSITILESVKP